MYTFVKEIGYIAEALDKDKFTFPEKRDVINEKHDNFHIQQRNKVIHSRTSWRENTNLALQGKSESLLVFFSKFSIADVMIK